MVCGDSSYMTSPRWGAGGGATSDRGLWSNVTLTNTQSPARRRRLIRLEVQPLAIQY